MMYKKALQEKNKEHEHVVSPKACIVGMIKFGKKKTE